MGARGQKDFEQQIYQGPGQRDAPRTVLATGAGSGLDADTLDGHDSPYFLARANHTGTQLAATVSDFSTAVGLLNAATATKLATPRTIATSGKATGTATAFDGSASITIPITAVTLVAGDIPNIAESQVTNLVSDLAGKEPTIAAGTSPQYWRGDKSWQTLNAAAVAGLGTMATQNANAVAITGGSITALTTLAAPIGAVTAGGANGLYFDSYATTGFATDGDNLVFRAGNVMGLVLTQSAKTARIPSDWKLGWASATNNAAAIDTYFTRTGANAIATPGSFTATGALAGSNFSGSSSGTNTGDQTSVTGNAGTATALQTARNFSISGGGITAAAVGFDGTAVVVLSASVDAGHITLARQANVATATVFYRKTTGSGAPEVQTLATLKTDLGLIGTNTGDQTITLTGDLTGSGTGSFATTLATVNAAPGSFGSATKSLSATVNAKGLITALSEQIVTPAVGSITGLGTGVATALAVNVGAAGAFVAFNGAGGTPSSLTLTNATGLPIAGLTASTSTVLGVGSIELGNASDTTLARSGAGDITIEGNAVYRAGGTDVPVADGGTGRSTSTTAYGLIAAGTTATGAHQTLAAGATTEMLVGGGASALPVWTTATGTGAPVRAGSPTLTGTTNTGAIQASDAISVSAWSGFGSGNRGHFYFNSGATNLLSYNGSTGTYLPLILTGSTTTIGSGATAVAVFDAAKLDVTGRVTASTYMKTGVYTVATLPAAATAGAGAIAYVTDALAPTFLGAVVGGGAIATTVYSDGTTWKAG